MLLRKMLSLLACALLAVGLGRTAAGQDGIAPAHAPSDSTAEPRIDSTWAQVERLRENGAEATADSLQRTRAEEFFRYYLKHPDSDLGRKAAQSAFLMWGNSGAVEPAREALRQVGNDRKIWTYGLQGLRSAYGPEQEKYVAWLQRKAPELERPIARSTALLHLAAYHQSNGQTQRAKKLYREIIDLNANRFFAKKALSRLHEMGSLPVGQDVPDFTATTLRGRLVHLSDFRGKVVVLEFWATGCDLCHAEIPHLKELWSDYRDEDLMLIGVALNGKTEKLRQFAGKRGMTWPQIQQPERWGAELAERFGVLGIPKSYVIDRSGTIVARDLMGEELEEKVRKLMDRDEDG